MTASPEISVVMGVYNNADTLPEALDSILSQDGVVLEFIVVDDGSTDASAAILDEAAKKESRLKVVHKENQGLTRALIDGCALASAPWIARQDADDISLPGRLKAQLERAKQADAPVFVTCGVRCCSPEGEEMFCHVPTDSPEKVRALILDDGRSIGAHGMAFFSKVAYEEVGGYRSEFYYAQDLDLFTRLARSGPVVSVPAVLYAYTFSPHSISTRSSSTQKHFRKLIQRGDAEALQEAAELSRSIRAGSVRKAEPFAGYYFIGACLRSKRPEIAKKYFWKAFQSRPWSISVMIQWCRMFFGQKRCMVVHKMVTPIPLPHPSRYCMFAVSRRIDNLLHHVLGALFRANVHVVGAYFSGNLGDWTMGQVIKSVGKEKGFRPELSGYGIRSKDTAHCLIMGGGELGDSFHFQSAIRSAGAPSRVAVCGINPVYNFDQLPDELLTNIALMPFISVRSVAGAELMRRTLDRADVRYSPDPVFCLFEQFEDAERVRPSRKRMAINIMTFYLSVQGRKCFASDSTLKSIVSDSEFAAHIDTAGNQYIYMMRTLVSEALDDGWEVVNIPFSEVDAMFAEVVLSGLSVKTLRYTRNPSEVLNVLRTCRKFVATRFHAHLFGWVAQVPVSSIGYSGKCAQIWQDLGFNLSRQISRLDVCRDPQACAKRLFVDDGVVLPGGVLQQMAADARRSIEDAYEALRNA